MKPPATSNRQQTTSKKQPATETSNSPASSRSEGVTQKQETRNKKQETRNKKQETNKQQQATTNQQPATESMDNTLKNTKTVILADGSFPTHEVPLKALREAGFVVCCDGAAGALVGYGMEPDIIIGDIDSLDRSLAGRYSERLIRDTDQETNDLTKAVMWCSARGATEVVIVGATGKREDHTLGNISLLSDYGKILSVKMLTDTATLFPEYGTCKVNTFPGQRVSIFSLDSGVEVTSEGLKYPLTKTPVSSWWRATLNTATGTSFTLSLPPARLIICLGHEKD